MKIVRFAPRFSDAGDVARMFCARSFKRPFSAEIVYLPFVMFRYAVEATRFFGGKKTSNGLFLADLIQGVPMNIGKRTTLKAEAGLENDPAAFWSSSKERTRGGSDTVIMEAQEVEESQILPVNLAESEAIARGKRLLRYDLMRLSGGLRYRRVEITLYPQTQVVYYPYWLVYYRGRRAEMKFTVLDGLSGRKESEEICQSIRMGLVKKTEALRRCEFSEGTNPN